MSRQGGEMVQHLAVALGIVLSACATKGQYLDLSSGFSRPVGWQAIEELKPTCTITKKGDSKSIEVEKCEKSTFLPAGDYEVVLKAKCQPVASKAVSITPDVEDWEASASALVSFDTPDGNVEFLVNEDVSVRHIRDDDEREFTAKLEKGSVVSHLRDWPDAGGNCTNALVAIDDREGSFVLPKSKLVEASAELVKYKAELARWGLAYDFAKGVAGRVSVEGNETAFRFIVGHTEVHAQTSVDGFSLDDVVNRAKTDFQSAGMPVTSVADLEFAGRSAKAVVGQRYANVTIMVVATEGRCLYWLLYRTGGEIDQFRAFLERFSGTKPAVCHGDVTAAERDLARAEQERLALIRSVSDEEKASAQCSDERRDRLTADINHLKQLLPGSGLTLVSTKLLVLSPSGLDVKHRAAIGGAYHVYLFGPDEAGFSETTALSPYVPLVIQQTSADVAHSAVVTARAGDEVMLTAKGHGCQAVVIAYE